jgi:hypothetical protein
LLLFLMALRLMACLALVAAYSCGRWSGSSRDCASATGLAASLISKMWSHLAHLEDVEPPLHEGDDPPVMEVRDNRSRAQPGVHQVLQLEQSGLQPVLA